MAWDGSPQCGSHELQGELSFVQISDSHMGFDKAANPDVVGTLKAAVNKINALPVAPAFILHTGDISHLSKPEEFDTVDQLLKSASTKDVFFVPGEHDVLNDEGKQYLERYGKGSQGSGWYSFDKNGVHFVGLVNVLNLKAGGLGSLGPEQLEWLEKDVQHLSKSTPIVVFAHMPLWSVYPEWGWGTDDSAQALVLPEALRFGHRLERTHPSDHAENRGQHHIPYRGLHGFPATETGRGAFSWADESSGGQTAYFAGRNRRQLRSRETFAGRDRFEPGLNYIAVETPGFSHGEPGLKPGSNACIRHG